MITHLVVATVASGLRNTEKHDGRLHGRRFFAMLFTDGNRRIRDVRTGLPRNTTFGALIKQWRHWRGCRAIDSICHYPESESTYVNCFEKVGAMRCAWVTYYGGGRGGRHTEVGSVTRS